MLPNQKKVDREIDRFGQKLKVAFLQVRLMLISLFLMDWLDGLVLSRYSIGSE